MAVTIKKIAEMAGVSIGTVDRVINNRGRVSPEVETRIRLIIKEMNYTPNLMAKSLVMKKNPPKIGVIFHMKTAGFNDEVMKGIQQAQQEIIDFGVQVIIRACNNFNVDDQLRIFDELLAMDVKAIAVTPINDQRIIDKMDALIASGFPIFCFINDIETRHRHPFIGTNAYETGCIAAGMFHLISPKVPQRLAVITPSLKMSGHVQRILGLKDSIMQNYPDIELADICEITNDEIMIYKTVKKYFQENPGITSLWYSTSISDGGIRALEELGLLHKINIITLDIQSFITKGLEEGYISVTLSQEPFRQGYLTIKTIFDSLLAGQINPDLVKEVPCEIVIRENIRKKIDGER